MVICIADDQSQYTYIYLLYLIYHINVLRHVLKLARRRLDFVLAGFAEKRCCYFAAATQQIK